MAEFKPMVKMMTTEPSVVLKLKKGGPVKKMDGGVMGGLSTMPRPSPQPPMKPMGPTIRTGNTPVKPMNPRMGRGLAPARMKHGGEMESEAMQAKEKKAVSNVEKKLAKHADMPASKAHKGLKTGGVAKGQGGYKTGGVVNGQGGFKAGGSAKKLYATGGKVDSGAPVAMPERKKSPPVSIDRLSGTFKKGGKVSGGSC